MVDTNNFKRTIKKWVNNHPDANEQEFLDFCEEQIPPAKYPAHKWLIEQAHSWFKHVISQREMARAPFGDMEDVA